MRAFDSAKDTYLKFNMMTKDLSVVKEDTSNGFFKRQKPKDMGSNTQFTEIQKSLYLMNEIKNLRESYKNGTT